MKHAIYKGSIVDIQDIKGSIVYFMDDGELKAASRDELVDVDEDNYKIFEPELVKVENKIKELRQKIYKLDSEYDRKKNAYWEMLMTARQKEISIIDRLLKARK